MYREIQDALKRAEELVSQLRVLLDLSEPSRPDNVSASVSGSTATITWDEAIGAPRVSHYKIYRDGVFLTTDTDSPYDDSNLSNGTYSYTVSAVDANGREGDQSSASQVTIAVTPPNPDVPISFLASAASATGINLTWAAGPAPPAPTDYDLDFATAGASGPWTNIAAVGLQTSYSHTALTTATQYWYRLAALNGAVPSDGYATATETTDDATPIGAANFIVSATPSDVTWSGLTARVPVEGGAPRAVRAGDIIELQAGTHGRLTLADIVGTQTDKITIRGPATGVATITASTGTSTLWNLNNLRHVIIDGQSLTATAGTDGKRRNIKVAFTGTASPIFLTKFFRSNALSGYTQTRNIVIRYVEIDGNWSGEGLEGGVIGIGTNGADTATSFPTAWHENMIFEHNYIHNCSGEGIYCGSNTYKVPRDIPNRYIKIRNNRFTLCGGNALDLKSWYGGTNGPDQFPTTFEEDTNNSVHDNEFFRCGTDDDPSANPPNSPNISMLSIKADIYNNVFEGGAGWAINHSMGSDTNTNFPSGVDTTFESRIYNNIIKGCGTQEVTGGIVVRAAGMPAPFRPHSYIYSNTIISNAGTGVQFSSTAGSNSFARNNIVLDNSVAAFGWGPITNEASKNLTSGTLAATFVTVGSIENDAGNFELLAAVPVAPGSVLGTDVAATDIDGNTRTLAGADKGAYEL